MYLIHRYWARKPYNIVGEYIGKYCKRDGVVLDPFCGSGVTVAEAVFGGRRAIGFDINPFAVLLSKVTLTYIDPDVIMRAFYNIRVKYSILSKSLYGITCPYCGSDAEIAGIIWHRESPMQKSDNLTVSYSYSELLGISHGGTEVSEYPEEIRIYCKNCGLRNEIIVPERNPGFFAREIGRINRIIGEFGGILKEYGLGPYIPNLYFKDQNGLLFKQLRHSVISFPHICALFTPRQILLLALILKSIKSVIYPLDSQLYDLFRIIFTATVGQSNKMVWVITKRRGKKLARRQIGSWSYHYLGDAPLFYENNPDRCFFERVKKAVRAMKDLGERIRKLTGDNPSRHILGYSDNYRDVLEGNGRFLVKVQNATSLPLPDNSVDYIFTDPPYGDSIQYLELSSVWSGWLGLFSPKLLEYEIIINSRRGKDAGLYFTELKKCFAECFRVLKPGCNMTVTFHNTNISIRNRLIRAVLSAGFKLIDLIFIMPPRNSLKSYLHYNNSAVGDYFIDFLKNPDGKPDEYSDRGDFGVIVPRGIDKILSERGEPVYMRDLLIFLDMYLIKSGIYPPEDPSVIFGVIEKLIGDGFYVMSEGMLGFPENRSHLYGLPLTERIKEYLGKLTDEGIDLSRLSYSEIYNLIYSRFGGILTPDRLTVRKIADSFIKENRY